MKQQIFVYLLDEGTDAWRSIEADHLQDDLYIITSENPNPEDEQWQFNQGDKVHCQARVFSDGKSAVVAISKAE